MRFNRGLIQKVMLVVLAIMLVTPAYFGQVMHVQAAFDVEAESAILVDAKTGKILFQKNIDKPLPTASMTKMMSEYLVLEAINEGKITWDQQVPISEFVRSLSLETALSNVPLRQDATYTVKQLYQSVAIYSANASTIALAELIAGSETAFVKMMNDKAAELDLGDYKFVNSSGLNNRDLKGNHPEGTGDNEENIMSARATAKLAYHLINDYPEVLETASIPKLEFQAGPEEVIEMENWNWMLPTIRPQHDYDGVDGLKTGYTREAGDSFTGTANRDGLRFITVVMRTESRDARFNETRKLLDYGYGNFTHIELLPEGYVSEGTEEVPVIAGKGKSVPIATAEPFVTIVKNGEEELYSPSLQLDQSKFTEAGELEAPIEAGEQIGELSIEYTGEETLEFLYENQDDTVAVVTTDSVEKAGWFSMTMRAIGSFFANVWNGAANTVKGWFS